MNANRVMIAILIIAAVVMAIATPGFTKLHKLKAKKKSCSANMRTMEEMLDLYRKERGAEKNAGKLTIEKLVDSGYLSSIPQCPSNGKVTMIDIDGTKVDFCCDAHGWYSKRDNEDKDKGVEDAPFMEKTDANVIIAYSSLTAALIIFVIDTAGSLMNREK